MKKIVFSLILILLAVYVLLSVFGNGDEYEAEKLYYRAMKASARIAANPDVIPPKLLEDVEVNLKALLEKYPKTNVARGANFTLAEFYIYRDKYADALLMLDSIIKEHSKSPAILSKAHFLKGQAYEKQGNWANALKEYSIVRDDYTNTEFGIQMPMSIAKYYASKGMDADARQAYNEAALFYRKLEKDNHNKMIGYIASTLLMQTYMGMEKYDQAGVVLAATLETYISGKTLIQLLPQVEYIFVIKLKQPEKAIEIYERVKAKAKDERLSKFLDKKIAELKQEKVS